MARYNGRQFRVFTRGDESGLPDLGIRGLTQDNTGLWVVGCEGGISAGGILAGAAVARAVF